MPLLNAPCPRHPFDGEHEMETVPVPNGDGLDGTTYGDRCKFCGADPSTVMSQALAEMQARRHRNESAEIEALRAENADLRLRLGQRDRLLGLVADTEE